MPIPSLRETLRPFRWLHEPAHWTLDTVLELMTRPDTDYWQRTHYGFQRDTGHFFFTELDADFAMTAHITFAPTAQYDQCGLMCRVDSDTWIKCSAEYETPAFSHLGSVVTVRGYSDWATQEIPSTITGLHYKLNRKGSDFRIAWAMDGRDWRQMRITHLDPCPVRLQVGIYACSPTGPGFVCSVHDLTIAENDWPAH